MRHFERHDPIRGNTKLWTHFPVLKDLPTIRPLWRAVLLSLIPMIGNPLKISYNEEIPHGIIIHSIMNRVSYKSYGYPIDWYKWCVGTGMNIEDYERILEENGMFVSTCSPKFEVKSDKYMSDYFIGKVKSGTHIVFDYYSGLCTQYNARNIQVDQKQNWGAYESVHFRMLKNYGYDDDLYKIKELFTKAWGRWLPQVSEFLKVSIENLNRKFTRGQKPLENPGIPLDIRAEYEKKGFGDLLKPFEPAKTGGWAKSAKQGKHDIVNIDLNFDEIYKKLESKDDSKSEESDDEEENTEVDWNDPDQLLKMFQSNEIGDFSSTQSVEDDGPEEIEDG
jgi:hypothetical protein